MRVCAPPTASGATPSVVTIRRWRVCELRDIWTVRGKRVGFILPLDTAGSLGWGEAGRAHVARVVFEGRVGPGL